MLILFDEEIRMLPKISEFAVVNDTVLVVLLVIIVVIVMALNALAINWCKEGRRAMRVHPASQSTILVVSYFCLNLLVLS